MVTCQVSAESTLFQLAVRYSDEKTISILLIPDRSAVALDDGSGLAGLSHRLASFAAHNSTTFSTVHRFMQAIGSLTFRQTFTG